MVVRKFQEKTTEKYQNERIKYEFDRELAVSELRKGDNKFTADFTHLIQKLDIMLEEICLKFITSAKKIMIKEDDYNIELVERELFEFTVELNYLCRNRESDLPVFLILSEILVLINSIKSGLVSNQLVRTLCYIKEKSSNQRIAYYIFYGIHKFLHKSSNLIDESSKVFLQFDPIE